MRERARVHAQGCVRVLQRKMGEEQVLERERKRAREGRGREGERVECNRGCRQRKLQRQGGGRQGEVGGRQGEVGGRQEETVGYQKGDIVESCSWVLDREGERERESETYRVAKTQGVP